MKKIILLSFIMVLTGRTFAQDIKHYWGLIPESEIRVANERTIIPEKYKTFHLSESELKAILFSAPHESNTNLRKSSAIIELPLPNGILQRFRIVEAPVMAPELAAQFPEIKTFNVEGIDDPYANGKLDWTTFGLHAMIRSISGDLFIDPYSRNSTSDYISYYTADFKKDPKYVFKELDIQNYNKTLDNSLNPENGLQAAICAGTQLRKYRLAVACTGEYARAATGKNTPTTNEILSAVTTTINRVDGIYETELAIRMVLIPNVTSLLFANPSTDPFDGNNDGGVLIEESQTEITSRIGSANFDIGHTFSTGGGGLANIRCVCTSSKASGITGSKNPVGDPYDVDYVAHEIGHQFGGNHTFASATGACSGNGNSATRVEPGSGITIMAYAGICDENDIAPNSIAYFHTISFDEMMKFSNTGNGNSCPEKITTTNTPPTVTIGSTTFTIPFSTPFTLTGSATDPDGDSLTYSWEEFDNGSQGDWDSGSNPFFRSYPPVISPSRTFPLPSMVLSGPASYQTTMGEYLPDDARTLKFRLTARDNKMGGGGVCYAETTVSIANAGPFAVTSPNTTGIIWAGGMSQTVTWNVNKTNLSPINCANVNILVSTDGGITFTTLLANTPNDGTESIVAPILPSTKSTCRIKVESVGNIFFDINDKNFTITSPNGIDNLAATNGLGLQLVPNPATNQIQINLSGVNKNLSTQFLVMDMMGKVIVKDAFRGKDQISQNYDLSELSQGIYIVEVRNEEQKAVQRLVKQ